MAAEMLVTELISWPPAKQRVEDNNILKKVFTIMVSQLLVFTIL